MTVFTDHDQRVAGLTITMNDVSKAGHCAKGARAWFRRHGLDFRDFLKNGISAQDFIDKGDALSAQVVERTIMRMDRRDA